MDILLVSPEVIPFARSGGLSDVSFYLARSLAERGHSVRIITPKYRLTDQAGYPMTPLGGPVAIQLSRQEKQVQFFRTTHESGVEIMFVGCDDLFDREGIYGNEFGDYEDNAERFILFCRAVLECIKLAGVRHDIIHCHNWQTGLVPVYMKTLYEGLAEIENAASIFTFHNLGDQGIFEQYDFAYTGLGWEYFTPEALEFKGKLNMAKAGLIFADTISTVSHTYAAEVLEPEFAFGLESVVKARKADLYSVLNGVDYQVWDPASDIYLTQNYSPDDLSAKQKCSIQIAQTFDLDEDDTPIAAVISSLVDRKGLDIITQAMDRLIGLGARLIVQGRGEDQYYVALKDFASKYPKRIGISLDYEKSLAHKILAGADIFMMPSRFEPCGLEQLYSLKYGTVPLVRATGGLDDTIIDNNEMPGHGTGFKFKEYTSEALLEAMSRAVKMYKDKEAWTAMMINGMNQDYSWTKAASKYEKLYRTALEKIGQT